MDYLIVRGARVRRYISGDDDNYGDVGTDRGVVLKDDDIRMRLSAEYPAVLWQAQHLAVEERKIVVQGFCACYTLGRVAESIGRSYAQGWGVRGAGEIGREISIAVSTTPTRGGRGNKRHDTNEHPNVRQE